MYKDKCPKCQNKLEYVCSINNEHVTGDEKNMRIEKCNKCGSYHLIVSMEAKTSYGENYFKFRIDLENDEADRFIKLMKECPRKKTKNIRDCCPAHAILDDFDYANMHRRVILEDEIERWKSR